MKRPQRTTALHFVTYVRSTDVTHHSANKSQTRTMCWRYEKRISGTGVPEIIGNAVWWRSISTISTTVSVRAEVFQVRVSKNRKISQVTIKSIPLIRVCCKLKENNFEKDLLRSEWKQSFLGPKRELAIINSDAWDWRCWKLSADCLSSDETLTYEPAMATLCHKQFLMITENRM